MPGTKTASRSRRAGGRTGTARPAPAGPGVPGATAPEPAAPLAAPAGRSDTAPELVSGTAPKPVPKAGSDTNPDSLADGTVIARCVREELARYFEVLDGEPPSDLYRAVMRQAEAALLRSVLERCRGNQSRAATWLGISRGTLRGKLTDLGIR